MNQESTVSISAHLARGAAIAIYIKRDIESQHLAASNRQTVLVFLCSALSPSAGGVVGLSPPETSFIRVYVCTQGGAHA